MNAETSLAPCGLDCSQCAIFIAAHDPAAAERLAQSWRANGFPKAEAGWFRCRGCRGDPSLRWSEDCAIVACASERGLLSCSACADFACTRLQEWGAQGHHRQALERLRQMRAGG